MAPPAGHSLPRSTVPHPADETAQPTMNISTPDGLDDSDAAVFSPLSPTFGPYIYSNRLEDAQYFLPPPGLTDPSHAWMQGPSSLTEPGHYPSVTPGEAGVTEVLWHLDITLPKQQGRHKRGRPQHPPKLKREPSHSQEDEPLPKQKSSQTKLRTASRSSKKPGAPAKRNHTESTAEDIARTVHNQVEQQYRKRLNSQFEQLLAVLPAGRNKQADSTSTRFVAGKSRFSKSEVLDLARERIKNLEHESAALENDKKELQSRLERIHAEWVRKTRGQGH